MTDVMEAALLQGASAVGAELSSDAAALLIAYLRAILVENESLNLTSVSDPAEGVVRHLVDSLAIARHVREHGAPPLLVHDIGTGAGFPGIPIAVLYPHSEVALVESRAKKLVAVQRAAARVGISNLTYHPRRYEDLRPGAPGEAAAADLVVARAVAPLGELVRFAARGVGPGATFVAWKSITLSPAERQDGERRARALGLRPLPDVTYHSDQERLLVRFRRPGPGEQP